MSDSGEAPLPILAFYWKVVRGLPSHVISSADLAFNLIGIVSTLLLLFNQPLARKITEFDGFSPWFAIAPVLALTLLAMIQETHGQYESHVQAALDARRDDALSFQRARAQAAAELEAAHMDAQGARAELAQLRDAQPRFVLGEPKEVENQILGRTHLVPDPSVHPGGVANPPQIRVPFHNVNVNVWRIPLSNEGGVAENTHVELTSIDRGIAQGRWPGTLHLAGENPDDHSPERYVRSRAFLLSRGGTAEIDLVAMERVPPYRCFIFAVESGDALCEVTLGDAHTFRLTAFGGGVSESQNYWVRIIAGDPARLTVERRPSG